MAVRKFISLQTFRIGAVVICAQLVAGCSYQMTHSYKTPEAPSHSANNFYQAQVSQLSVKAYAFMLADELLNGLSPNQVYGNIAVVGFVDQVSRKNMNASGTPLNHLGGQLEESFVFELNKRGFSVADYKLMSQIKVTEKGDTVWSRDASFLEGSIDARYFLSGTLTEHEKGAVVNVRLMKADGKKVLAAAQGFVPSNVFWSEDGVALRDGYLMHKGERRRTF